MQRGLLLTSLLCHFIDASLESALNITPCKISDDCINNVAQSLYKASVLGDSDLGIDKLDPMYHEKIEGKLSIISYTITNSTITGFERCTISNTKFLMEKLNIKFTLNCPEFDMFGIYDISGRIIVLPIHGNGDFTLTTKNYDIDIDARIEINLGKDGKKYMTLKNVHFNGSLKGGLNIDLKNLFDGQQDLAEPVLQFMNDSGKEVVEELQGPILSENIKKLVKNINKYLKMMPIESIVIV